MSHLATNEIHAQPKHLVGYARVSTLASYYLQFYKVHLKVIRVWWFSTGVLPAPIWFAVSGLSDVMGSRFFHGKC